MSNVLTSLIFANHFYLVRPSLILIDPTTNQSTEKICNQACQEFISASVAIFGPCQSCKCCNTRSWRMSLPNQQEIFSTSALPGGSVFLQQNPFHVFSMIFTYECYHIHHFLGQHPVLPSVDSSTGRDIPDVHFGLREVALVLQQMSSLRSPTEATHIRHHVLLAETHQAQVRTLLDKKQCKRCFFRSGMIWFILKENT